MAIVTKRTTMSLYSDCIDVYSHFIRIVLAEKGINVDIIEIDENITNEDLLSLNPYGTTPTLIDRDLILYEPRIIMEYLDERFPHPPLLPVYPVLRAEARKMLYRIEQDWYCLMHKINAGDDVSDSREKLLASMVNLEPIFADKEYFLNEDFSLLDCSLGPLLWRFPKLGIYIPETAKALHDYMQRIFMRDSFQRSLSDVERQLRVV